MPLPPPRPEAIRLDLRPLRTARRRLGMSQARLAAHCDTYPTAPHYWERNTRRPTLEQTVRASRALGVPLWEIIGVIEDKPTRARISRR